MRYVASELTEVFNMMTNAVAQADLPNEEPTMEEPKQAVVAAA